MSGVHRRRRWWLLSVAAVAWLTLATVPAHAAPQRPMVPPMPLDPSAMVAQVGPTVVDIDTQLSYQSAVGSGTGMVIDPNGVVLTNNHVVAGATGIKGVAIGNGQAYDADVLGYDRSHDVAVLQLRGAAGLPVANIGNSSQVAVGDPVIAMGNAGGQGGTPSAVPGRVIATQQTVTAADELTGNSETLTNMIKSDTPIRPGDSGGPLVDGAGQVVGMNTAASGNFRIAQGGGEGYAIPIEQAMGIANQIRSGAASPTVHIGDTAFLGVGVVDQDGPGVKVQQVLAGTPAEQAGLNDGDVITAVDGRPVNSANDLTGVLDQHHPGDSVAVTWQRGGAPQTGNITLSPGPVG